MGRQWVGQGDEVTAVTCFPNHPAGVIHDGYEPSNYCRESIDGIVVHRHWTYVTPNRGFLKKTFGHMSYVLGAGFFSTPRINRPDVIIGSSPTLFAAYAAMKAARKWKVPFVMEVRDLWPGIFVDLGVLKNQTLIRVLEKWELSMYSRASRVVTVTDGFRRDLVRRNVPAGKVTTITNGADMEFWDPKLVNKVVKQELGIRERFVVLYIGAIGISHGLNAILEAASLMKDRRDILFLFVGEGADKDRLQGIAKSQRLANVRFVDAVQKSAVRNFYAMADVCLVPLRNIPGFDTFIPSKMFEIMCMERPIVASLAGEAASILRNSGAALVVAPEDSRAIAHSVLSVVNNAGLAERLASAGRAFVAEHYSRDILAGKYRHLLEEAIEDFKLTRK